MGNNFCVKIIGQNKFFRMLDDKDKEMEVLKERDESFEGNSNTFQDILHLQEIEDINRDLKSDIEEVDKKIVGMCENSSERKRNHCPS